MLLCMLRLRRRTLELRAVMLLRQWPEGGWGSRTECCCAFDTRTSAVPLHVARDHADAHAANAGACSSVLAPLRSCGSQHWSFRSEGGPHLPRWLPRATIMVNVLTLLWTLLWVWHWLHHRPAIT
jgi:hypothetical protein